VYQKLKAAMAKGKELQAKYRTDFDSKDLKLQVVPKLGAVLSINKARKPSNELRSKLDKLKGQTSLITDPVLWWPFRNGRRCMLPSKD